MDKIPPYLAKSLQEPSSPSTHSPASSPSEAILVRLPLPQVNCLLLNPVINSSSVLIPLT